MSGAHPSDRAGHEPSRATPSRPTGDHPLRVLSLFAGIGGFDLGLERTGGFKTVAFCEFDKKAQRVLAKHWPEVPIYDDVRTLTGEQLAADGIAVDCIVGGFPCQDISTAGACAGIEGERSGLWADYARLIGEIRPEFIVVENVSALLNNGMGRVLGDMAALGYDAEWHCIPASSVGAPHRRDRIWIVAYPNSLVSRDQRQIQMPQNRRLDQRETEPQHYGKQGALAHADSQRGRGGSAWQQDAKDVGQSSRRAEHGGWHFEPPVGRVANGVPGRVDRLKQLGNAVVPQIPELIGRAILASLEAERLAA